MTPRLVFWAVLAFGFPLSGAAAEVIAELEFIAELPEYGPVGNGHIAIDLAPPGRRPFPLLLDTAASRSTLTPLYARALRVPDRGRESDAYRVETALGRELEFVVDDRSGAPAGLLGGDFLESAFLEIDYAERVVLFLSRYGARVRERDTDPAEIRVPVGLVDGRPIVEIELGSGSAWFVVDTGSAHDLRVSEHLVAKVATDELRGVQINFAPQQLGDLILHGEKRQSRRPTQLKFDENIHITVRREIVPQHGAEQGKPADMMPPAKVGDHFG